MSEPGGDPSSGISSGDALILPERHPACRRREARPGFRTERENLRFVTSDDVKGQAAARSSDEGLKIWPTTCATVYRDAIPETVAAMIDLMQRACRERGIDEPADETLKPHARRLLEFMRDAATESESNSTV